MVKNYIKTGFRNIVHHKKLVGINIFSLSLGLSLCLIMLMYVAYEFSFEDIYPQKSQIYRLKLNWDSNGNVMKFAGVMPAFAEAIKSEFPEVEETARLEAIQNISIKIDDKTNYTEDDFFFTDASMLNLFSLELNKGNSKQALTEPYSIILTESIAEKYFGSDNPLDKTLVIDDKPYKITGVIADRPVNTHFRFKTLISYSTLISEGKYPASPWNSFGMDLVYIRFKNNFSIPEANEKVQALMAAHSNEFFANNMQVSLQSLTEIHWDGSLWSDIGPKGNLLYTYLFLASAILILVIAGLNYINLSSSLFMDRTKEIGIRKVIGASRKELVQQFLTESILISIFSVLLGVILFQIFSNAIYNFIGNGDSIPIGTLPLHYIGFIILLLMITALIGLLPALYFSNQSPIKALKRSVFTAKNRTNFRFIPVILQFIFSSILICSVIIIFRQINFMVNSDLGFDKNNVIYASVPTDYKGDIMKYNTLKNELSSNPAITQVSGVFTIPGISSQSQMNIKSNTIDNEEGVTVQALPGDYDFVDLLGLEMVAGRNFSVDHGADATGSVILNQSAVKALKMENPIGEVIEVPVNNEFVEKTIIGVVKDFHFKSLHNPINPVIIMINPDLFHFIAIRYNSENEAGAIADMQEKWQRVFPDEEPNIHFMADDYNKYYETEEKAGILILIFSIFGLLIAGLGLVGLISFIITKKIKEIGIRKVLGASIKQLVYILSKQFLLWVCIANLIAWPVAYFIMEKWLQNFAYRIGFSVIPFLLAGVITILIAVFSVIWQTVSAARSNPIKSLRYE